MMILIDLAFWIIVCVMLISGQIWVLLDFIYSFIDDDE